MVTTCIEGGMLWNVTRAKASAYSGTGKRSAPAASNFISCVCVMDSGTCDICSKISTK